MIILTGYQGFIGQAFKKRLDPENLYRVEQSGAFDFLSQYDKWDEVEMILHQGAISSTTETDVNKIHKYNVCLLYTSPSPRDATLSRMPSSA